MDKRYQVFISSTRDDLKDARQEVSQALLQTDCFPAGMELFPAADDEQFEFIKSIIDQSDYYIVVSAGRYGSIHPGSGLSYTEMEFDYAVGKKIPIIALLHDDLGSISADKTEPSDSGKEALKKFREKLKTGRIVRMWKNPHELGAAVITGLQWAKTHKPAVGWVRADRVASDTARIEIAELKEEVAELKLQLERQKSQPIDVKSILAGFEGEITFELRKVNNEAQDKQIKISVKRSVIAGCALVSCLSLRVEKELVYVTGQLIVQSASPGRGWDFAAPLDPLLTPIFNELEAVGLLNSAAETYETTWFNKSVEETRRVWELTEPARRWAAREANALSKGN